MILEARKLAFAYRRETVLHDVDLTVAPGLTAIVGPNAAGKSTLLRCLCGLLRPSGEVLLNGCKIRHFSRDELARRIGYLPQDLSTTAAITVFEAVLLGRLHRLSWHVAPSDLRSVEKLLDELGLADLAARYVSEVSGGQLQMVAIAQALAREPAILLLDEPTASLDLRHQLEVCDLVCRLATARGMSVAMAMHDLSLAARFADTVCVLSDGCVAAHGPPADVLTASLIARVYRVEAQVQPGPGSRPVIHATGVTS